MSCFCVWCVGVVSLFAPAFTANICVFVFCLPPGIMHPRAIGVFGKSIRVMAVIAAIVCGVGGCMFCRGVFGVGFRAMRIIVEGFIVDIIFSAFNSCFILPWCSPMQMCGAILFIPAFSRFLSAF